MVKITENTNNNNNNNNSDNIRLLIFLLLVGTSTKSVFISFPLANNTVACICAAGPEPHSMDSWNDL
jgi:hypothetical protein